MTIVRSMDGHCTVRTEDGLEWRNIATRELTPVTDLRSAWTYGSLDDWDDMRHVLRAQMLLHAYQSGDMSALSHSRLMLLPHQVFVAHRVVSQPEPRFLLADEPGLGKTIEAGLVVKELLAREQVRRVLIITPASLTTQWQQEMRSKFGVYFDLYDGSMVEILARESQDTNPWLLRDHVIASLQFARRESHADRIAEAGWDLVIFDEAHHLRVSARDSYRLADALSASCRAALMLTATPMQLSREEFYDLLALLAPGSFRDSADLEDSLYTRTNNLRAMAVLRRFQALGADDRSRVCAGFASAGRALDAENRIVAEHWWPDIEWLSDAVEIIAASNKSLSVVDLEIRDVVELENTLTALAARWTDGRPPGDSVERWEHLLTLLSEPEQYRVLEDDLAASDALSAVMIRNRRQRVFGASHPGRRVLLANVRLTAEEKRLYDAVTEYVQEGYALAERTQDTPLQLIMVLMQRLLTSSVSALSLSLQRRRERLAGGAVREQPTWENDATGLATDDDGLDVDPTIEDAAGLLEDLPAQETATLEEIRQLDRLIALAEDAPVDSKAQVLVAEIARLRSAAPEAPPKVLVFTQFLQTQAYLCSLLEATGLRVVCFNGSLGPEEKDRAIAEFRRAGDVLISTEAGGEGRNLQFCHLMVNYDLPWNPMRVEQRIGRLDRIGQKDQVVVLNLAIQETLEGRILKALHERVHLFEETIGALDPVLGEETEEHIAEIVMRAASDAEITQRIDELANDLAKQQEDAGKAGALLGDFIMDTNSWVVPTAQALLAPHETGEVGERLAAFVTDFLARYPTAVVEERQPGVLDLETPAAFIEDCRRYLRIDGIPRAVTGTFGRESAVEDDALTFLSFGHPLVDAITEYCVRCDEHGRFGAKAAAVRVVTPRLAAGRGFLFLYETRLEGITQRQHLQPIYVPMDGPDMDASKLLDAILWGDATATSDIPEVDQEVVLQAGPAFARSAECAERGHLDALTSFAADNERQAETLRHRIERRSALFVERAQEEIVDIERQVAYFEQSPRAEDQRILPAWRGQLRAARARLRDLREGTQHDLESLEQRADAIATVPEAVACLYVEVET